MRILSAVALLASILPGVPRAESAASLAVVDLDPLGDASGAPHDRLYARLSYRSAEPVRFIAHGFSGGERAGESIVGSDWQLVSERLPDCLRHPGPARGRGRLSGGCSVNTRTEALDGGAVSDSHPGWSIHAVCWKLLAHSERKGNCGAVRSARDA
jgi:hypothetical protein